MLYSLKYLRGLPLLCNGEECGKSEDFYFEDGTWRLRHIVANDGSLVFKKRSLVSPKSIDRVQLASNPDAIPLAISKEALESAPAFDSQVPFSREVEAAALAHYHLAPYWVRNSMEGAVPSGPLPVDGPLEDELPEEEEINLRSLGEVLGYSIHNDETSLGDAFDLIMDMSDFSIAYLAVDTKPGERGGVRLISTTQKDVGLTIDYASSAFRTKCSVYHLLESPSADLSEGRLSLGDQQKIDLSSY